MQPNQRVRFSLPPQWRKPWIAWTAAVLALLTLAAAIGLVVLTRRLDPFIRQQAIEYLEQRFDSDVQVGSLQVRVPLSALGSFIPFLPAPLVRVEGRDIQLQHHGSSADLPPMFVLPHFVATVDLGTLVNRPRTIRHVLIEGMELNIPPKEDRAALKGEAKGDEDQAAKPAEQSAQDDSDDTDAGDVVVEQVDVRDAKLRILTRDPGKVPLEFDLKEIHLQSVGRNEAMRYEASLTNAKPPGEILSEGTFGPWAAGEPGDTPLGGTYLFENADLGVFTGIAGILTSTGEFEGTLSSFIARGEATVPDFRLTIAGNPVPLSTQFEVHVDGTNGNTELRPVIGKLGETDIRTAGFIVRKDGEPRKTIDLDASIENGRLRDVLLLAMKDPQPMMSGTIDLQTRIAIPPLDEKVKEKLILDGEFEITDGKFLKSNIQNKLDGLSRRGQGEPDNEAIDEIVHRMSGSFDMQQGTLTFSSLAFSIPGAAVNIGGDYDMLGRTLDFHGALLLEAKVSETVTGWKRWVLKPIDPFFSKRGAGTFLHIKVTGDADDPKFGLDPGGTSPAEEAEKAQENGQ